jgi:fatty acid-binding protein DegV
VPCESSKTLFDPEVQLPLTSLQRNTVDYTSLLLHCLLSSTFSADAEQKKARLHVVDTYTNNCTNKCLIHMLAKAVQHGRARAEMSNILG